MLIKRVLIANRGEIVSRIIKTLKRLKIESVAIFHEEEKYSLHTEEADVKLSLGSGTLFDTYLNIQKIISLAKEYNCDAVHPGYGFLSENHQFAQACEESNLIFIGPQSNVIHRMGIKSDAKEVAKKVGIPVLGGQPYSNLSEATKAVKEFPVLIKAVAGGGGKGLKIVPDAQQFGQAFVRAQNEALNYFGNGDLMLEPYIENARHIEVQVLGDKFGNVIHLFDRECSIQRNHQKIIEEAPSTSISKALKDKLYKAAVSYAGELNYQNAGTVEFLVKDERFWFLEMNTRIQVEHPVTEMVTGIDLVEQQINIAEGKELLPQKNIACFGNAIEARIYAEDAFHEFQPSIGQIDCASFPQSARVDTFIRNGTHITPYFDAMLAKIVVKGNNRKQALNNLKSALGQTVILGVKNNLDFLNVILSSPSYTKNEVYTTLLSDITPHLKNTYNTAKKEHIPSVLSAFIINEIIGYRTGHKNLWEIIGKKYNETPLQVKVGSTNHALSLTTKNKKEFTFKLNGKKFNCKIEKADAFSVAFELNNEPQKLYFKQKNRQDTYTLGNYNFEVSSPQVLRMAGGFLDIKKQKSTPALNQIHSPLFGKVIGVNVKKLSKVSKGDLLLTIESMKTENHIFAPGNGIIKSISVNTGDQVKENLELMTLLPIN